MLIDFDPVKNRRNIGQRGLSFERAADFDFETALFVEDDRRDYGEKRIRALGMLNSRMYSLVFVAVAGGVRVVSLRKANAREVRRYESQIQA